MWLCTGNMEVYMYNTKNECVYLKIWHKIMHVRNTKESTLYFKSCQYYPWRKEELKLTPHETL